MPRNSPPPLYPDTVGIARSASPPLFSQRRFGGGLALLVMCLLSACSLTAPSDAAPTYVTVTPASTATQVSTATLVPQLATRPPTETPLPTDLPCMPRDDWFVYTVNSGDSLAGIALRAGAAASAVADANCIDTDIALNAGEGVRVPVALLPPAPPPENAACVDRWFFTFRTNKNEITIACPNPILTIDALGQDFQGGRMIRMVSNPTSNEPTPLIFVIFNNGFWQSFPDTWDASQPARDETIVPPDGLLQPIESMGKIWRENPSVRTALGWAYTLATPFTGRVQFPQNRNDYWYLDYGTARLALRLTRSGVAPNGWEIVGEY